MPEEMPRYIIEKLEMLTQYSRYKLRDVLHVYANPAACYNVSPINLAG